jgi:hypothetical protein
MADEIIKVLEYIVNSDFSGFIIVIIILICAFKE